jgi:transcriptional antiterminator RfaH
MDSQEKSSLTKLTKWYAINTNPRCEDMVYSLLNQEGFQAFLPKIKNKQDLIEPLFPGYLFISLDVGLSNWVKIKYLHGVRRILSLGGKPMPVPESIIATIDQSLKDGNYSRRALSLKAGDRIRFTRGPFEGLEGLFTGEVSGKERVKVLLRAINNYSFTVEVEATQLSRVS